MSSWDWVQNDVACQKRSIPLSSDTERRPSLLQSAIFFVFLCREKASCHCALEFREARTASLTLPPSITFTLDTLTSVFSSQFSQHLLRRSISSRLCTLLHLYPQFGTAHAWPIVLSSCPPSKCSEPRFHLMTIIKASGFAFCCIIVAEQRKKGR